MLACSARSSPSVGESSDQVGTVRTVVRRGGKGSLGRPGHLETGRSGFGAPSSQGGRTGACSRRTRAAALAELNRTEPRRWKDRLTGGREVVRLNRRRPVGRICAGRGADRSGKGDAHERQKHDSRGSEPKDSERSDISWRRRYGHEWSLDPHVQDQLQQQPHDSASTQTRARCSQANPDVDHRQARSGTRSRSEVDPPRRARRRDLRTRRAPAGTRPPRPSQTRDRGFMAWIADLLPILLTFQSTCASRGRESCARVVPVRSSGCRQTPPWTVTASGSRTGSCPQPQLDPERPCRRLRAGSNRKQSTR